jgi:mRNA interferase MazF
MFIHYPSEAFVILQCKKNKAMADQITTVSKLRLISLIDKLSENDMQKVERAIKVQLGLVCSIRKGLKDCQSQTEQ